MTSHEFWPSHFSGLYLLGQYLLAPSSFYFSCPIRKKNIHWLNLLFPYVYENVNYLEAQSLECIAIIKQIRKEEEKFDIHHIHC